MEPKTNNTKPNTMTLVMVNLLAWCVILGGAKLTFVHDLLSGYVYEILRLLIGFPALPNPFSLIGILLIPVVLLVTTIGQLIVHIVVRNKTLKPWKRILLFAGPSLLVATILIIMLYLILFHGAIINPFSNAVSGQDTHYDEAALSQIVYR